MMFGEYPQGYLPQLFVACVVVPGTKLGDVGEMGQRFDDNKRVEGTLVQKLLLIIMVKEKIFQNIQ